MKPMFFPFLAFLIVFMTACTPARKSQPDSTPSSSGIQPVGEVSTGQGGGQAVGLPSPTPDDSSSLVALPVDGVTLADNGKTFSMQVGESFLLNLGTDVYEWTAIEIDRPDVLQRKMGVTVIQGAQGIFVTQASGTAVLTASGDPLCLKLTPPCKLPSILFHVTLIVK